MLAGDSGCGPLGLLILAVAKAYGVKKIVMFDIEKSRTRFAESYGADVGIVTPRNSDPSQDVLSFSQHYAREVITKYGLGYGFDVAIEASGAEICATMAICMLKAGGTCELRMPTLVNTRRADRYQVYRRAWEGRWHRCLFS